MTINKARPSAGRVAMAALLALSLVAAACAGSDSSLDALDEPEAASASRGDPGHCTVPDSTAQSLPSDLDGSIQPDPQLEISQLDNGLTVYVRENDSPGQRGQFALVIRAGSVLESDDQSGAAHFLEHMLFNGTDRWPANEMVEQLQRFGSEIGPDINAWTSYDETVYWLELPDVDDETIELASDILLEWASRATVEQSAVEDERGVVVEERRLTDEGAEGRIGIAWNEMALEGSPFEGRSPIGELESIESMDRGPLVDFYEDWYRPDLMAVVAVGDFDADEVTDLITDRFDELDAVDGPERPDHRAEAWSSPRYESVVEPDEPLARASVFFPIEPAEAMTGEGRRDQMVRDLAMAMLATRLEDDISAGTVPMLGVRWTDGFPVASLTAPSIDFQSQSADLGPAVEAVLAEMERVCRFGFSEAELDRVADERRAAVEQEQAGWGSTQDNAFAIDYVDHFLVGDVTPDGDTAAELDLAVLDTVTVDEVTSWFAHLYGSGGPSVIAIGPDEVEVPSDAELAQMVEDVLADELEPRSGVDVTGLELMERPTPAEVVSRTQLDGWDYYPGGAVELGFENGARVILMSTPIHEGFVALGAESFGGTSVLAGEDIVAGQLLGSVVTQSGVATFDQVTLTALLADRDVELGLFVDDVLETLGGGAATEDVETLLQLVHLYMTQPRVTEAALASTVGGIRPVAEDPLSDPDAALFSTLTDIRYAGEPRYAWPPGTEALDALTTEQVQRVAEDRFGNAGDFVFAIVGDFDPEELEELAAAYIGTLPASESDTWVDQATDPPAGVEHRVVETGTGDQGRFVLLYTSLGPLDVDAAAAAPVLQAVVTNRLLEMVREELGASYNPSVEISIEYEPDELVEVFIDVSGNPSELDDLAGIVLGELTAIAGGDVSDDEVERARSPLVSDYELASNELFVEKLLFYARHPDASAQEFHLRGLLVQGVDRAEVVDLAERLLAPDRYIEVQLKPG